MIGRVWRRISRYLFEHGPEIAVFVLLAVLLAVVVAPRMIYSIPAGHAGVHWKRFAGTVLDHALDEGLHIIPPWDEIYIYDTRLQLFDRDFDVLSSDGLSLSVNIAYRFQLVRDQVPLLHKTVGANYAEVLLTSAIGAHARDIFGRNTPEEIYSHRRADVQAEILNEVQADLPKAAGSQAAGSAEFLRMNDVFIRSIKLPPIVAEAINRKNQMQQRSLEYDYRLLLESKESERKRIEAQGIKEFQDIVSQGITESYLRWRGIDATQALATSPNSKTVIIGSGPNGLPIILGGVGTGNEGAPAGSPPTKSQKPSGALAPEGPETPPAPAAGRAGSTDLLLGP